MAEQNLPLLLFPQAAPAERSKPRGGEAPFRTPGIARQRARVEPKLQVLRDAFEAKRLRLQQIAPNDNPELVIVFETVGAIENFARAASKIPGLESLFEWEEEDIAPDEDFYVDGHDEKRLSGRLFLVGSNQVALQQLLGLWDRYKEDPTAPLPHGFAPWKHVFEQLKDVRYWSVADRVGEDVRAYWRSEVQAGKAKVRFEIDAWHSRSEVKNQAAHAEVVKQLQGIGGQVISRVLLPEIAYHGMLAEVPSGAIENILVGEVPDLLASDRIMFFRPRAQAVLSTSEEIELVPQGPPVGAPADDSPVVALLDGLPLQNHSLLAGRLIIDDPDGWEAQYEAKDRVHATAMASLIIHGDLDSQPQPLARKIYVRPLLRPDPNDKFNQRRIERTPDDILLIDLVHRAVKRICEGENGTPAVAPTVRVINLSLGDETRIFDRSLTPWARLIDWLAFKYRILFVVSAGNYTDSMVLDIPRDTLGARPSDEQRALLLARMLQQTADRRLLSPAESLNAITIGATHHDGVQIQPMMGRFDLCSLGALSPLSRIGFGYRRAVKPDVLMPGGRTLYRERIHGPNCTLEVVYQSTSPGLRAAIPPLPGEMPDTTTYSRGTSNAAALASRHAGTLYDVVAALRATAPERLDERYDAVLLKALLAHGASWATCCEPLLAARPDLTTRHAKQEFLARWLGYGAVDTERAIRCTAERATLIGFGEFDADGALVFSAPLPPSLAGKRIWRRLTVTLAWLSPVNPGHLSYRRAKLWITPPHAQLHVSRELTAHYKTAQRGTLQHEVLEGEDALSFVDGDRFECKVNCAADAGELAGVVPFALCVSLEVAVGVGIPIYQEIRQRIALPVAIQPKAIRV